jgi:hypothetical protein
VKFVELHFQSATARRNYLAALRKRWLAVGYSKEYITDFLRATFDPKLSVFYVYGRDDADRAADVAIDVPGVSYKFHKGTA